MAYGQNVPTCDPLTLILSWRNAKAFGTKLSQLPENLLLVELQTTLSVMLFFWGGGGRVGELGDEWGVVTALQSQQLNFEFIP